MIDRHLDGSRASAMAMAAALPRHVARSLLEDAVLMVIGKGGLLPVRAGEWIVREPDSGVLVVWPDAAFRRHHHIDPLSE